ncbi:hypothetical protein G9A89_023859 [Geosiphon pyriformis]|nr:hypothetical protein G9A89_023859 [Geosiphon pyriformis]
MTIRDAYSLPRINDMLDALEKAKFFSTLDLETTDALHTVFGAILSQLNENGQEQVITYANRTLKPTELKYDLTKLETATVIWALKYFQQYLKNRKEFNIIIDNISLK